MSNEEYDFEPNPLCVGCVTYYPEFDLRNHEFRCDFVPQNNIKRPCPCNQCLIKSMCQEVCPTWHEWRPDIVETKYI